jgi:hypothetical protein
MKTSPNERKPTMKAIWMQTDKNGKTRAYYWSNLAIRAIPMKMADAEAEVLAGTARLLECHPLGR